LITSIHPLNGARSAVDLANDWRTAGAHGHGSVLLVDQERSIIEVLTREISSQGVGVICAHGGREALAVAHRVQFRLLLLHLELPDMHGLDVVRALRGTGFYTPFMAVTGCATMPAEAKALGALRVFPEPFDVRELGAAVASAVRLTGADASGPLEEGASDGSIGNVCLYDLSPIPEPHTACDRWCNVVIRLATSEYDLRTNEDCADHLGVCSSVFGASCRRVHVTASNTRNFARMIRAIRRSGHTWIPDTILNIDDARTLKKFEERSGIIRGRNASTPTMEEFLERQQWIPRDNPVLLAFERRVLGRRR